MSEKTRKFLSAVLLVVFLISTGGWIWSTVVQHTGADTYADAAAIARKETTAPEQPPADRETVPPETEVTLPVQEKRTAWVPAPVEEEDPLLEELAQTDLQALREVNPDVVGWIHIPDTRIDYPIMQGEDNDFYLNHNWMGQGHIMGSIFLEYQNDPALTDYNTVIYGHNMSSGAMFHDLHALNYPALQGKVRHVYIVTDGGVLRYDIFATYDAAIDSITYRLGASDMEDRAEFLTYGLENSLYDYGVVPELRDQIITLSTCSGIGYGHRRVVQARLSMMEITLES